MAKLRSHTKFGPVSREQLQTRADRLESLASGLRHPVLQFEIRALAIETRARASE
jgi:hypothetical protein